MKFIMYDNEGNQAECDVRCRREFSICLDTFLEHSGSPLKEIRFVPKGTIVLKFRDMLELIEMEF